MEGYKKYRRDYSVNLKDRQWPNNKITRAPIWCSVDLRDGNQALAIPMGIETKIRLWNTLLKVGFKEVEVGFPAASDTEYNFTRRLIDGGMIPDGVAIQVLTQSREKLIRRTFESLRGAKEVIVHLYNSTSTLQRKITFNMGRGEILKIATDGAKLVRKLADELESEGTKVRMEYSPESFNDTELDFALEICEAVKEVWKPSPENKLIVNLPETVQYTMPNVYADHIEWMSRNISERDKVLISVHTHNDRGTGVASTELAMLAGADRVEGTLFGNGERTGNLDIVNVALNMHAEGVDPALDFHDLPSIRSEYEECTGMKVPPRQPYAGDLVFTAFSGSHQDAIKKGMDRREKIHGEDWEVPYLLIDPKDIGRSYEAIIRINSQSGKGGVAYILEDNFGFDIPKSMHPEVGDFVNGKADKLGRELSPLEIRDLFFDEFVKRDFPVKLDSYKIDYSENNDDEKRVKISAKLSIRGDETQALAWGNGPINALVKALEAQGLKNFKLIDYRSHAIGKGSATNSAAYVCLQSLDNPNISAWGAGIDSNIESAGLKGLICAYNRLQKKLVP